MWSFGALLFELCTGRALFLHNQDDNLTDVADLLRWEAPSEEKHLSAVFKEAAPPPHQPRWHAARVQDAKALIQRCLAADPAQRPSMAEVLRHPFFTKPPTGDAPSGYATRGGGDQGGGGDEEASEAALALEGSDERYPDGSYALYVAIDNCCNIRGDVN